MQTCRYWVVCFAGAALCITAPLQIWQKILNEKRALMSLAWREVLEECLELSGRFSGMVSLLKVVRFSLFFSRNSSLVISP